MCKTCNKGDYCPDLALEAGKPCSVDRQGHDCDSTGIIEPRSCLYGEYSDVATNGKCEPCPADQYCQANALVAGTDCPNGYECKISAPIQFPNWVEEDYATPSNSNYHLCPKGNYCDNS